jgi:hypothetical protein
MILARKLMLLWYFYEKLTKSKAQMEQNKSLQQQTTAVLSETSRDKVKYEADLMAIVIY